MYEKIKKKDDYDSLLKSGMFFEFHPELSGNWEQDKNTIADNCSKMSKENENLYEAEKSALIITDVSTSTFRMTLPLEMIWQPKEDITAYELAMCLPYLFRKYDTMPYEVDKSLPHFKHFKITDRNIQ